jgi:hypothetical protein
MALSKCEDCGNQVSTEAVACPNCGRPMKAAPAPEPAYAAPAIWPPPQPVVSTQPAGPKQKNWFRRHPVLTVILAVVVLAIIGAAASNGSGKGSGGSDAVSVNNVSDSSGTTPVTGRISGDFQSTSGCLGCGSLIRYVHADDVWCGWQGDQVLIHVRFHNDSVEHVTIDWHPSYVISDGGSHGAGLTSLQSSGINPHSTRVVVVKQSPEGTPAGSAIGQCEPAFSTVDNG